MEIAWCKSLQRLAQHSGYVIFKDEFFLVQALKQLAAQRINGLPLLVHHVVIFQNVFARLEVLRFHRFLRGLDAAGNQARLDGNALFHSQPLQQLRYPGAREDAHQVIFKREIEAR